MWDARDARERRNLRAQFAYIVGCRLRRVPGSYLHLSQNLGSMRSKGRREANDKLYLIDLTNIPWVREVKIS